MKKGHGPSLEWNDDQVALLKREWAAGKTAARIAALLGGAATRNAVVGKAHRLGLAGRASPIKHRPGNATSKPKPPRAPSAKQSWQSEFWTAARKAEVRKWAHVKPRQPIRVIADHLGCSTASVHRFAVSDGLIVPLDKRRAAQQRRRVAANPDALKRDFTTAERFALREVPASADSLNVPLSQLSNRQCHFATSPHIARPDQHRFCGAEAEPPPNDGWAPYCAHHHGIVFRRQEMPDSEPIAVAAE